MKKIFSFLFAVTIILFTVSGCAKEDEQSDCTKGSNKLVTENRGQGSISSIVSNSPADIIVKDTTSVFVSAEDNLLSFISTEVSSGTLTVNLRGGCIENHYPFTVIAPASDLSLVRINGEGSLTCEKNLASTNLTTEVVGLGNIEYKSGNVAHHQIRITGAGSLEARNLTTGITQVNISGSGNCYVKAENELTVTITGSGNVFYIGNPQLNLNITGTGKVTRL